MASLDHGLIIPPEMDGHPTDSVGPGASYVYEFSVPALSTRGWKDTVLVMPGERVQLGLRFVDYTGRYLVHCHNLEHENAGMMRNFLIS